MWLVDVLIAVGVYLYSVPIIPLYAAGAPQGIALLLVSAAICGAYVLRRRYPLGVLGIMLLAASAQLLLGAPLLPADAMLLFAVYNAASLLIWWVSSAGTVATIVWLLATVTPRLGQDFIDIGQLGLLIVVTLWCWTWGRLVQIRRRHIDGLREQTEQLAREKEAQATIVAASERARIAREIHDIVSHSLSVVVLMSDGAASKVDSDPDTAKSAMLTARDTGRTALSDMRRMLGVLREDESGSHAPQPRIAQLPVLVEQTRAAGLPVTLTNEGEHAGLPEGLQLTVYRLAQEALTNVRRHAGDDVSHVDVGLHITDDTLTMSVADDGRGPQEPANDDGHGLVGMRERVASHGGVLSTGERPGGGFEMRAVLPIGEGRG